MTGRGRYLDDIAFDRLAHAVVLRSPHAHARIAAIDAGAARAAPGVLAVLTAAEAAADGLSALRPGAETNTVTGEAFLFEPQPLLAAGKVRHVGEAVALIVAETRDQALDAAELVAVDYVPLTAATTAAAARAAGAPLVTDKAPGNLCLDWRHGDRAAADAAFAAAAHVVTIRLDNHRVVTNPMEPRGIVGTYDAATGRYTAYVSAQSIHVTRDFTARALGADKDRVRFVAPDVGGGFGAKNCRLSRARCCFHGRRSGSGGRSKWIATRSRGLSRRPCRARPACGGLSGARQGRPVPGAPGCERGQSRRLSRRQFGERADLSVCVSARHGVPHPGGRPACPRRLYQYDADRRVARSGLCRGQQHHGAADRAKAARQCGFDRVALRRNNLVPAAAMPAMHQRGRQPGRQRRVPRDLPEGADGLRRCCRFCPAHAKPVQRGAGQAARAVASPATSRAPAAIPRRMSTSASRPTGRYR